MKSLLKPNTFKPCLLDEFMHETHIANQLIAAARTQAPNFKEMVIEVGDLGHVPARDLEHHFKAFPWKTTILEKEATVECPSCAYKGPPLILEKSHDLTIFECPQCGKLPKIIDGADIKLVKVIM